MKWRDDEEQEKRKIALYLLWVTILAMALVALVGCKTTEYVEVPVTHTEYVYRDRVDTAFVKDSVYIKEQIKGDTITRIEYRYRDRFRYINTTDTLIQRDTISVVHTEVVEKQVAKMNSLQGAFFWLGLLTFICGLGFICYKIMRKRLIG